MRREGRLHGYEFDREESQKRVKARKQPTNRSKFRSKYPQEKAGRPRYKALKKMKGQRNKAHASDVAANHKLHDWSFHHTRCATLLTDSIDDADVDPMHPRPPSLALGVLLPSPIRTLAQKDLDITTHDDQQEEEEEEEVDDADKDSNGSDWFDLGSLSDSDDEWFLC